MTAVHLQCGETNASLLERRFQKRWHIRKWRLKKSTLYLWRPKRIASPKRLYRRPVDKCVADELALPLCHEYQKAWDVEKKQDFSMYFPCFSNSQVDAILACLKVTHGMRQSLSPWKMWDKKSDPFLYYNCQQCIIMSLVFNELQVLSLQNQFAIHHHIVWWLALIILFSLQSLMSWMSGSHFKSLPIKRGGSATV